MNEIEQEKLLRQVLAGECSEETYRTNYLIEAGAGAGKTHIMVNRIVNQLTRGLIEPENLAAITFTEKATQEMLGRIDGELLARLSLAEQQYGSASEQAAALRSLLERVDRMQVSTIHSFCRTLLLLMPYQSALGPDFELEEDSLGLAGDFFDRAVRAKPDRFSPVMEENGLKFEDIRLNFVGLCELDGRLVTWQLTAEESAQKQRQLDELAGLLYLRALEEASLANVKNPDSKTAQEHLPVMRNILRMKEGPRDAFVDALLKSTNPCNGDGYFTAEAFARLLPGTVKANKAAIESAFKQIEDLQCQLLHAQLMPALIELREEYRADKRKKGIATQNDLLIAARDMLRDSPEARRYLHRRYQTIYVDEMQDTDPVQAQILFYLTTDEEHFSSEDWRLCQPVPGSLFLVGDPKQAIYRFRGADISVYKILTDCFRGGVGQLCSLHFNFRSSSEICRYVDSAFADRLTGGAYQAEYSSMTADHGGTDRSFIMSYRSNKDGDADRLAAFITKMVESGIQVGVQGDAHPARYSDFMILTRANGDTQRYVRALSRYGVPSNMAGEKAYGEILAILRANLILSWLADRQDELKLGSVLVKCYGVGQETLAAWRGLAGRLTAEHLSVQKALAEAGKSFEGAEDLFPALDELRALEQEAMRLPAFTLLEDLFFQSYGVWGGLPPTDRREEYAMVCQYLRELRDQGPASFPELAERAADLLNQTAGRELLLEEREDCVRIMNLHKAKGLEAEIILLAYGSTFKDSCSKYVAFEGNQSEIHWQLNRKTGPYPNQTKAIGIGPDWEQAEAEEVSYLQAEIQRLLYVAATRAKTGLVICDAPKSTWYQLSQELTPAEEFEPKQQQAQWEDCLQALLTGVNDSAGETPEALPLPLSLTAGQPAAVLAGAAEVISAQASLHISPSMLERHEKHILRRDEDEDVHTVTENHEAAPGSGPHGADWGTIMHRVLELAVKARVWDGDSLRGFAGQAYREVFGEDEPSAGARRMLLGGLWPAPGQSLKDFVVAQAAERAAFLTNESHPLRQLLDGAVCYPELPFILREEDTGSELARAAFASLVKGEEKPLSVNGVIDLAVKCGSGWTIVDYKTDVFLPEETEEQYVTRLKQQYSPQLQAYRLVLDRLGQGSTEQVYICALQLAGRLLPL